MQILNVGAGRTDEEYKAAEEQRRADLRNDVQAYAQYFFVAAGLAALTIGLLNIRVNIIVNIGIIDLLALYGGALTHGNPLVLRAAAVAWAVVLLGLGWAARKGYRTAFWAGVILYGADMLCLMVTFSIWAIGVHAFFVFKWWQGQNALRELKDSAATQQAAAGR